MDQHEWGQTFGIIGLGRFGMSLAKQLAEAGREVIALDCDEMKVKQIREFTEHAYVCDNLTKEALYEAGIGDCDIVVVCIGEKLDTSILTALHVQTMDVPHVFAKATSVEHGQILEKMGVTPFFPEQEAAAWAARSMISHHFLDYLPISDQIEVAKIQIGEKMMGKTVGGMDFRKAFGLNIIAVEHKAEVLTEVDAGYVFRQGDVIVVLGKAERILRLEEFMEE